MQPQLGSNAAQFAAELADRFGPARSERVARDFYDRFIELLGFARPADDPGAWSRSGLRTGSESCEMRVEMQCDATA
jgi:hypothetical protein